MDGRVITSIACVSLCVGAATFGVDYFATKGDDRAPVRKAARNAVAVAAALLLAVYSFTPPQPPPVPTILRIDPLIPIMRAKVDPLRKPVKPRHFV
jgi:hypothetical protein